MKKSTVCHDLVYFWIRFKIVINTQINSEYYMKTENRL